MFIDQAKITPTTKSTLEFNVPEIKIHNYNETVNQLKTIVSIMQRFFIFYVCLTHVTIFLQFLVYDRINDLILGSSNNEESLVHSKHQLRIGSYYRARNY